MPWKTQILTIIFTFPLQKLMSLKIEDLFNKKRNIVGEDQKIYKINNKIFNVHIFIKLQKVCNTT